MESTNESGIDQWSSEIQTICHQEDGTEIELAQVRNRDEIIQSWVRLPQSEARRSEIRSSIRTRRKNFICSIMLVLALFFVFGLPIIKSFIQEIPKMQPKPMDNYSKALKKALMFFNAQRSGKLPRNNNVRWRGDSGLNDGDLVGGYYNGGDNIKYHFPMAFSMTLLSWSVIEYHHKYKAMGEYRHVKSIIRWGTDYLLKTFDANATDINFIYSQVGIAKNGSTMPDDHYCWTRPEDMDYPRPTILSLSAPDFGGEVAAALAAASIVFKDESTYSSKLINGASLAYKFARRNRITYSENVFDDMQAYNSTGYWDEYMWCAAWMYYATGNESFIKFGTDVRLSNNAKIYQKDQKMFAFSWDNKLPGAILIWTRLRMLIDPGYPYEESLKLYHDTVVLNMCSYIKRYHVFNWTKGGLIQLNHGHVQKLEYVVNAVFIANLYSDYADATDVPGFYCGSDYFSSAVFRTFASSQLKYVMGKNPINMSYIVSYGMKFPQHVHHRGASIPVDGVKYSCREGIKWLESKKSNPNAIVGAMVGGPDINDGFMDYRVRKDYTEPTLSGNAGLVAALVSMSNIGGRGIDKNTIFEDLKLMFPEAPPPPEPWRP